MTPRLYFESEPCACRLFPSLVLNVGVCLFLPRIIACVAKHWVTCEYFFAKIDADTAKKGPIVGQRLNRHFAFCPARSAVVFNPWVEK